MNVTVCVCKLHARPSVYTCAWNFTCVTSKPNATIYFTCATSKPKQACENKAHSMSTSKNALHR